MKWNEDGTNNQIRGGCRMKKWFVLLMVCILCFGCCAVHAETKTAFDHKKFSMFSGYEYNAKDGTWEYGANAKCLNGSSYSATHMVGIYLQAYGDVNTPEEVNTSLYIAVMDKHGNLEDVKDVSITFDVDGETCKIQFDRNYVTFTSVSKEALKYMAEGSSFICVINLENSSTRRVTVYPTAKELADFQKAAKNLIKYNVVDYTSDYAEEYYPIEQPIKISLY